LADVVWTSIPEGYQTTVARPAEQTPLVVEYQGMDELTRKFHNTIKPNTSVFSLGRSLLETPKPCAYKRKAKIVLVPCDQQGVARRGPNAVPPDVNLTAELVNTDPDGIAPVFGACGGSWVVYNDCLVLPFTLQEQGEHRLAITAKNGEPPIVVSIPGVQVASPEHCLVWGPGLVGGVPDETCWFHTYLSDYGGKSFQTWAETDESVEAFLELPDDNNNNNNSRTKLSRKTKVYDAGHGTRTMYLEYTHQGPKEGTEYFIHVEFYGIPHPLSPFKLLSTHDPSKANVPHCVSKVTTPRGPQDQKQPLQVALGENFTFEYANFDKNGKPWCGLGWDVTWGPGELKEALSVASEKNKTGRSVYECFFDNSPMDKIWKFTPSIQRWMPEFGKTIFLEPFEIKVVASRRVVTTCAVVGAGLHPAPGKRCDLVVRGADQDGTPLLPEEKPGSEKPGAASYQLYIFDGANPTVPLETHRARTETRGEARLWYTAPSSLPNGIILVLQPREPSTFSERFLVLPPDDQTRSDPAQSFILWHDLTLQSISTATLYAVSQGGQRRHVGGDIIQVRSVGTPAIILSERIVDNRDGTYTINMWLPREALITHAGAQPKLEVWMNGTQVQGSPQVFPFPADNPPPPFARGRMPDAGVDGRLPSVTAGDNVSFLLECLNADGSRASGMAKMVTAYLRVAGSKTGEALRGVATQEGAEMVELAFVVPSVAGEYLLSVWVRSVEIQGSPYKVTVEAPLPQ
jgi:hypothetical protein